jgi:hypothetical protein
LLPIAKLLASSVISLSFPPVTCCLQISCAVYFKL